MPTPAPTPDPSPVIASSPLQLRIDESDLRGIAEQVKARQAGHKLLGDDDSAKALFDALPGAVAKRVQAITPRGFVVTELSLKLVLNGTVCGVGLSGDVVVKLAPDKAAK